MSLFCPHQMSGRLLEGSSEPNQFSFEPADSCVIDTHHIIRSLMHWVNFCHASASLPDVTQVDQ